MYDIFYLGNNQKLVNKFPTAKRINSIQQAQQLSLTKLFWIVWNDLTVRDDFNFDYIPDDWSWSKDYIHIFKNGHYFDGILLVPKRAKVNLKEVEYRVFTNKKEIDILASTSKQYDIVFISYQESNADKNYAALKERFPYAKRVHGVKGIHQAHVDAANLCDTDMFWIVDGDAQVVEDFNFDYQVPKWQHDQVFVWQSQNPINDLVYGYGGIKLFPRKETISMDINSTDMTTSISSKFNLVEQVSNITEFNTSPFETWKSAFRECCKLASKTIDRQTNEETEHRLHIWQTVGKDRLYGGCAIEGAVAGANYGRKSQGNIDAINKINNFEWLREQFNE